MAATVRSRAEVEREIKETLGLVPSFFDRIPDEFLDPVWRFFERLELGETRIPNRYNELIGIALHAETKRRYCTLFHTEAAKMFGATDEETQEAVHYAKHSLGWSAYLNGMRVDYDQFADELQRIGEHMSAKARRADRSRAPHGRQVTLHAYELATLVAATRRAVEEGGDQLTLGAKEQLRKVLESYDAASRQLGSP